ncbi:MAG: SRPBCC domain-containing protein [Chloroflexi bacterium]|nr:SRPBCC domain-containing protein [Chloroflexota bacterium]MCI0576060.1 SRPBCC domain-containing protein [Chloroflexota bacterium]MCI0647848.1 SRPBCC domain-containing protein [Chloroflexota bacterium]MCI0727099.1 SRPBCC domain-containing protein [Chloroflexota bacterium]
MPEQPTVTQIASDNTLVMMNADFPRLAPKVLFDYLTVPELLQRWWPPTAAVEPRPGGRYRLCWPEMQWELFGEFTHFEPGRRLAYTWQWQHRPDLPTRHVDILIEPLIQGSRLTLTHSAYSAEPQDQEDRQSHLDGWLHFLGQLQSLTSNPT